MLILSTKPTTTEVSKLSMAKLINVPGLYVCSGPKYDSDPVFVGDSEHKNFYIYPITLLPHNFGLGI